MNADPLWEIASLKGRTGMSGDQIENAPGWVLVVKANRYVSSSHAPLRRAPAAVHCGLVEPRREADRWSSPGAASEHDELRHGPSR